MAFRHVEEEGHHHRRDFVLLEVTSGAPRHSEHIPGSIHLDLEEIEADERIQPRNYWKLVPDDELLRALSARGVTSTSRVVVYGESPLAAARATWAMLYAGVLDVSLLDGGLRAWSRSGGYVARGPRQEPMPCAFGSGAALRPHFRASLTEVTAMLADSDCIVADVRSRAEFMGTTSGYPYIRLSGAIPGARFAHGGPHAQRLEAYTDEHGSLHDREHVVELWKQEGITSERRVCFYCGTGWRAAVAFLFAHWAGWNRISVYDGGWMEWSALAT